MTCGIYKIKNIGDEKVYIGHSLNIEYRWRKHVEALKAKRHENIHLQRAWDKHGKDNFIFEKIRELYRIQKNSKNEISQKYGVSIGTVSNIVRNVVYKQNLSEIPVN